MGCSGSSDKGNGLPKSLLYSKIFQIYEVMLDEFTLKDDLQNDKNNIKAKNRKVFNNTIARTINYKQKQHKNRGCFGILKLHFYSHDKAICFNSLLVNIHKNTWAIFSDESNGFIFENSYSRESLRSSKLSYDLFPSSGCFIYSEDNNSLPSEKEDSYEMKEFNKLIMREMPEIN